MEVIGIDPGTDESAIVWYDWPSRTVTGKAIRENNEMLDVIRNTHEDTVAHIAIEMVQTYGKPVGAEVFTTCVWIGRFVQAFDGLFSLITRPEINSHLCFDRRAKDAWVRQALIDKFGPGKEKAIGLKKTPGPLYGIKTHMWPALAVCVTWAEAYCLASTEQERDDA